MEGKEVVYIPQHLCMTCKFVSKCHMAREIAEKVCDLEEYSFRDYGLNLEVSYVIEDCDKYKYDPQGNNFTIFYGGDDGDEWRD